MKTEQKLAKALAALAPFERAFRELRFITVDDLRRAAETHWELTKPELRGGQEP